MAAACLKFFWLGNLPKITVTLRPILWAGSAEGLATGSLSFRLAWLPASVSSVGSRLKANLSRMQSLSFMLLNYLGELGVGHHVPHSIVQAAAQPVKPRSWFRGSKSYG